MRTAAILPVKRFAVAKRRLGGVVAEPLRGELAHAMVSDVLEALGRCTSVERTIVVTVDSRAAATARANGAEVVPDPSETGQSSAASIGIERALSQGVQRVLCVPGDCPALEPAEVDTLLTAGVRRRAEIVIVPDRHETGTNGLLLAPPDAMVPAFGTDSFARHRRRAAAAGVRATVERPPSLLLDIDAGEDLAALRTQLDASAAAHHTRAVLAGIGVAAAT
jgi:2-phospho-L-lactate guanylyltransferase